MKLGIDASNLRAGGGVTHLIEVLRAADPLSSGFSQVIVWSGQATLNRVEERPWLVKSHHPLLDKSLPHRIFWQRFTLSKLARESGCDVLLVPGGAYTCDFRPAVTMSQNLLPFEWRELRRYGWSWMAFKLFILRSVQSRSFRRADGLILLTRYARDVVTRRLKNIDGKTAIIPHGINGRFGHSPREQKPISQYSIATPFRILYVSIVDMYKHQWHVVEAVAELRRSGLPVVLELVGPAYSSALVRLRKMLKRVDPKGEFVQYSGAVHYDELHAKYAGADLFVFASTCENMPNILLEGMVSGLPIACSDRGPMPEVLEDGGVYFNPEDVDSIAKAVEQIIQDSVLRQRIARRAKELSEHYSWKRCAAETCKFLRDCSIDSQDKLASNTSL